MVRHNTMETQWIHQLDKLRKIIQIAKYINYNSFCSYDLEKSLINFSKNLCLGLKKHNIEEKRFIKSSYFPLFPDFL